MDKSNVISGATCFNSALEAIYEKMYHIQKTEDTKFKDKII